MNPLESQIRRVPLPLRPEPRRVLLRPFQPSLIVKPIGTQEPNPRILSIYSRVMHLDDEAVQAKLDDVFWEFDERHQRIHEIFLQRF